MMTRKHFIKLASILKENRAEHSLVKEIANMCAVENPRFSRYRFYEASGLYSRIDDYLERKELVWRTIEEGHKDDHEKSVRMVRKA